MFPITDLLLTIGRAADNIICLDDELVGRKHASVALTEDRPLLTDEGSLNGTWVDGEVYSRKFLDHGDRLKFGSSVFLYFELDEPPDTLPSAIDEEFDRSRKAPTLRADYSSRGDVSLFYKSMIEALGSIVEAQNAISELDLLLGRFLEEAFKIIPARRGAFLLNGQVSGPDKWSLEVYRQRDSAAPARFTPSSKDITAVYGQRVPIMPKGIPATMCAPLIAEGRMRGVLYMEGTPSPSGFDTEDMKFLRMVAGHAIIALRVARRIESLKDERDILKEQSETDDEMLGQTAAMQRLWELARKAAAPDVTVLITGETGTGKGVLARRIHKLSPRKDRPFVTINCGEATGSLLPSDLFGHVKGAFTNALETRKGKLKKAEGGTVFIDEIGDLPPDMQPRLLRFLQEKEFEPVGGDDTVEADVRIIAATNVDLQEAVRDKNFRQDLFYRLNVFEIRVPPLRERQEDIPVLADHFIQKYCARRGVTGIALEAMDALVCYEWPGNIRELENTLQAAVINAESGIIQLEHLPKHVREPRPPTRDSFNAAAQRGAREGKCKELKRLMVKHNNNVPAVARELNYTERYVYQLLRECKDQ